MVIHQKPKSPRLSRGLGLLYFNFIKNNE